MTALPRELRPGSIPKPLPELAESYVNMRSSTDGFLDFLSQSITESDVAEVSTCTLLNCYTMGIMSLYQIFFRKSFMVTLREIWWEFKFGGI